MPKAKKRLGQHFLTDPRILARTADAAEAGPGSTVIEIGPGLGALTAELARRAERVIAIEKDRELAAALVGRWPNVTIVQGDALDADWHRLAGVTESSAGPLSRLRIAGNIPYNITSPLIDKALTPPRPAVITFLVQREVAERLAAGAGSPEYGALSVGVQAVAKVEQVFRISAGAFSPRPRVDSALIRLRPMTSALVPDEAAGGFRRLVVGLFGYRRKQLVRALRELTGWPADRCVLALARAGLDPAVRPETLSPPAFARLYGTLVDGGWRGN